MEQIRAPRRAQTPIMADLCSRSMRRFSYTAGHYDCAAHGGPHGRVAGVCAGVRATRDRRSPVAHLASFLFAVKPWDLLAFVLTPLLLSGVALIAVWIPATRATRVDPITAGWSRSATADAPVHPASPGRGFGPAPGIDIPAESGKVP
jgi:hypothetical protein